ncbi:MAG: asparagine synthase-related protein [Eubacterium sp.]|nr:asparagine synthase-related protein [Eubacterium sp.]
MSELIVDKEFCMSSYLMYRYVYDPSRCFYVDRPCRQASLAFNRTPVGTVDELLEVLKRITDDAYSKKSCALALSGGIDSAILASLVPKGTKAYTFRCVVPGVSVTDESETAAVWAKINMLDHEVIDINWDDLCRAAEKCMMHKNAPIHSIEGQIYLAAEKAAADGIGGIVFGENADIIYGGMDGLLAKDWTYGEFVDRYTYVMPYKVLRWFKMPMEPYRTLCEGGCIDGYDFTNVYFRQEALGTYVNACETAGVEFVGPYSQTMLQGGLDLGRVRNGDTKYLVRELFSKLYPDYTAPTKIPMPRPMDQWLGVWEGPKRPEFIENCVKGMSGDQRWMIWSLERYLDMMEGE